MGDIREDFSCQRFTAKHSRVRGFCVLRRPEDCQEGRETVLSGCGSPFGCLGEISLNTYLVCAAILRRQGTHTCVWQGAGGLDFSVLA